MSDQRLRLGGPSKPLRWASGILPVMMIGVGLDARLGLPFGYYGPAAPAPAAFARLSAGLDEAIVRIVTARPGLEPVGAAMAALTPTLIRAADR